MNEPGSGAEITQLREWQNGSREAFDRLVPLVYEELRSLTSRQVARKWRTTGSSQRRPRRQLNELAVSDRATLAGLTQFSEEARTRAMQTAEKKRDRSKGSGNRRRVR
jgi:hypothetical protein